LCVFLSLVPSKLRNSFPQFYSFHAFTHTRARKEDIPTTFPTKNDSRAAIFVLRVVVALFFLAFRSLRCSSLFAFRERKQFERLPPPKKFVTTEEEEDDDVVVRDDR